MKWNKIAAACMAAAAFLCSSTAWYAAAEDYQLETPTPEEIRQFYAEHPWSNEPVVFDTPPSVTAPYEPGIISDASLQNALNCLNFIRYTAGLPADVELDEEYGRMVQAGQLVNAVNQVMSHFPSQPAGMPDDLYELGAKGTSSANLWYQCEDLPQSLSVYACDMGSSNLSILGHRRWLLNPSMQYTNFGYVEGFTGVYAFDRSREDTFTGDYIAWPAQNMPYDLYYGFPFMGYTYSYPSYAFSVILGPDYDTPELSAVQVDMTSQNTGETFHFDESTTDPDGLYFNVDTNYYGIPKCIIFNPGKTIFDEEDVISVTVSGVTKQGVEAPITYEVRFFSMDAPEYVSGDVDADGIFGVSDVILLQKWLLALPDVQLSDSQAGDLDGNGIIDVFDLGMMKQMLLR